jgi:hypothetical protein
MEIAAFNQMSGLMLRPWEIEIIEVLDDQWMAVQAQKNDDENGDH